MPAQRQTAFGAARGRDHPERRGGALGPAHRFGQFGQLFLGQPAAAAIDPAAIQLGQELGDCIEPQPAREPLRCFDPAIGAHEERQGRAFIDHPRQAPGMALARFGFAFSPPRACHCPQRGNRPGRQQQRKQNQCDGGKRHGRQLCGL